MFWRRNRRGRRRRRCRRSSSSGARARNERRLGRFLVAYLTVLFLVAEPLRVHYEASLVERGRDDLLASPLPEIGGIWETDVTPPRVFGIRRPWQPEKSSRAQKI